MCGICFVCGSSLSHQQLEQLIERDWEFLRYRGPDAARKEFVDINDKVQGLMTGCVLWLQGSTPQPQPIVDQQGGILLWNGDILSGYQIPTEMSDTRFISDQLAGKSEEEMLSFLLCIKGPWSFMYYRQQTRRLYFGRDVFGRHSLLWQLPLPASGQAVFMLSSVSHQREGIEEVPAYGVYYVDFSSVSLTENFVVHLVPWATVTKENLASLPPCVKTSNRKINSCISTPLNKSLPSETLIKDLKSLAENFPEAGGLESLYQEMQDSVDGVIEALRTSIQRRVDKCPDKCQNCTLSKKKCEHSRVAVLFSGGLDSAMIALLLDSCLPQNESVDLLNVAFEQKPPQNKTRDMKKHHKKQHKKEKLRDEELATTNNQHEEGKLGGEDDLLSIALEQCVALDNATKVMQKQPEKWKSWDIERDIDTTAVTFDVPDRISGSKCWMELRLLKPHRKWNFVEINVRREEVCEVRAFTVRHLIHPLASVLDDSIGCSLWFAARGFGKLLGFPYTSPARVVLCGIGADEQLGGYARHRGRFQAEGWPAVLQEMETEMARIHTRNLGRDNRILAHHGRAPRLPYLDEDVVCALNQLPVWVKANLYLKRGVGEKLVLRVAAAHLGLPSAASLPKRAIQFGSRIAKMDDNREKGDDVCTRLLRSDGNTHTTS